MTIITVTEMDELQQKADNLESLHTSLHEALTADSTPFEFAMVDLVFMQFTETYDKIYALRRKNYRIARLNPITWFSKK